MEHNLITTIFQAPNFTELSKQSVIYPFRIYLSGYVPGYFVGPFSLNNLYATHVTNHMGF